MRTISITRALCELKLYDGKINSALDDLTLVDYTQKKYKDKALNSNKPIKDFLIDSKAKYDSLQKLMQNRDEIKNKINLSNSVAKVTVGEKEMTVAEAIETRRSLKYKRQLLNTMKLQYSTAQRKVESERVKLDAAVDNLVNQNIMAGGKKLSEADFQMIAKPFIESNEVKALFVIDLEKAIETLEQFVTDFDSDLDIILSESNSKTMVTLED